MAEDQAQSCRASVAHCLQKRWVMTSTALSLSRTDQPSKWGRFASLDLPDVEREMEIAPRTVQFQIAGVSCPKCVARIEALPQNLELNIEWSRVDLSRDLLTVARTPSGRFSEIAQAIEELGYKLEPVSRQSDWQRLRSQTNRKELIRLGVVAGLTGNIMLMAVSIYGGASGDLEHLFHITMLVLGLPVATWGAASIHRGAFIPLIRDRRITVDLPISIAVLAGLAHGLLSLFELAQGTFMDSVAMLVLLIQGSRTGLRLLRQKLDRQEDTLPQWLIAPVLSATSGELVSPSALSEGIHFQIAVGSRTPVDCETEDQIADWDLSILSGETEPLTAHPGVRIPAGARCLSVPNSDLKSAAQDTVKLKALCAQKESRIYKLLQAWRDSERDHKSLSFFSDRAGQIFVTVVLSLAFVLALAPLEWLPGPSQQPGWLRALVLMIVTCPCVFGFAIPLAESFAMMRTARSGLLVKHSGLFREILRIGTVMLDKTGTLTSGHYHVQQFSVFNSQAPHSTGENSQLKDLRDQQLKILAIAKWLQTGDSHPVAKAILSFIQSIESKSLEPYNASVEKDSSAVSAIPGGGRQGRFAGREYRMISQSFDHAKSSDSSERKSDYVTRIVLFENEMPVAQFDIADQLRPGAQDFIDQLKTLGLHVQMLTGDHRPQALKVARAFGLDARDVLSRLLPADKATQIQTAQALGNKVMMIGDGINDAEALKLADVGISIKGDFDACLENSDGVLTATHLTPITQAFTTAKSLRRALTLCLGFATLFNLTNGALAIFGLMSPLIAAVLMPISSLIVTAIAFWTVKPNSALTLPNPNPALNPTPKVAHANR